MTIANTPVRQAIRTKFMGPPNSRGSRVRATADAGSVTVAWDHALNPQKNHAAAAEALIQKLGWSGTYAQGGLANDGDVFVCIDD